MRRGFEDSLRSNELLSLCRHLQWTDSIPFGRFGMSVACADDMDEACAIVCCWGNAQGRWWLSKLRCGI